MFFFPGIEDDVADGRGSEGCLVLERWREVDAVVLTDITDGLRRELLRLGRDAHRIEDVTTGGEVAPEGAGTDVGQTRQRRFADKTVFVVIVNHIVIVRL